MSPGISTRLLATQSDERLLRLVRDGHERAFEALVHRYRRPLLAYCRRLPLPDARAEDVVQLTLLKAWVAVRAGTEIRDIKAWLYRVVHNTAVNAARDGAREREPRAELLDRPAASEPELDLGLRMREALAEVAALPPLQREVLVRTAVVGDSHERVAGDLGLSGGAVRGLLYRARTTLRQAVTTLTPPPLLAWLAGRANQGSPATPAPERLAELAGGGGTVGLGGLLLKGGVVAVTAGVLGGAALVHLDGAHRRHPRHPLLTAAAPRGHVAAGASATPAGLTPLRSESVRAPAPARPRRDPVRHRGRSGAGGRGPASGGAGVGTGGGTSGGRVPRLSTQAPGGVRGVTPHVTTQGAAPPAGTGTGSPSGSGQSGTPAQGGGSGSAPSEPVGSAASSGSPGTGSGSPPAGQGAGEGGAPPSGSSGSGSGGAEGTGASGTGSSGSSGSAGSSGSSGSSGSAGGTGGQEQAGSGSEHSLVGTVVHEVGSLLEHVLH